MNLNQLINMAIRMITRRLLNAGIDKGAQMLSSRGKAEGSPEQRKQAAEMAKRAKQAARLTRRMR
ncbi:MAG: hypothetical protein IE922_11695 [Sphingomonadales bacterium]|nr:hypothetical protein [Sphingomonadales bacterium]